MRDEDCNVSGPGMVMSGISGVCCEVKKSKQTDEVGHTNVLLRCRNVFNNHIHTDRLAVGGYKIARFSCKNFRINVNRFLKLIQCSIAFVVHLLPARPARRNLLMLFSISIF